MSKFRFSFLILILALSLWGGSVLAYNDISNPGERDAAHIAVSLGLMEETAPNVFSGNSYLTRSEFARLTVKMLGFTETALYSNFTIFPDVKNTLAEAPYINAAVRKYGILRGFPDGTFKPQEKLTYAQAITVYLNILGYTIQDIGPFWPDNYITKAQELGLGDFNVADINSPLTRSQGALLAVQLLHTTTKNGTLFLKELYPQVVEDALLLATWQTSSAISKGKAEFLIGGQKQQFTMTQDPSVSLLGQKGRLIYDPQKSGKILGFLPEVTDYVESSVKTAYADRLELEEGIFAVPRNTLIYFNGQVDTYQLAWFNILPGHQLRLYYDNYGVLELVSLVSGKNLTYSFIYQVNSEETVPGNATVYKNGAQIKANEIKKYDVVSYDGQKGVYYVSDMRLKGYYQKGYPLYTYPEVVTIFNQEFKISEEAAKTFEKLRLNMQVVLLFDALGNPVGAFSSSEVSANQIGVLKEISGGGFATIELLNGLTIQGTANLSSFGLVYSSYQGYLNELLTLEGQLVEVSQNLSFETINITPYKQTESPKGDWLIKEYKLGSLVVAPEVKIFEKVTEDAPLLAVAFSDLPFDTIKEEDIRFILKDRSGRVNLIVLADITGLGWNYGRLTVTPQEETLFDGSGNPYTAITSYRLDLINSQQTLSFTLRYWADTSTTAPFRVPKGMGQPSSFTQFLIEPLEKYATVQQRHFDGDRGINLGSAYLPFATELNIYAPKYKQFLSLVEARGNYDNFTVYLDRPLSQGGQVVFIIAE